MEKLKRIVEDNTTHSGKIFDLFIQSLIFISLVSFTIETIPYLNEGFLEILNTIEVIVVIIFSIEYILRVIVADKKLRFIFSFYGLIDLCAILPFYLTTGIDLRSLRIIRFLRVLRAFKLFRYSKAVQRFALAFKSIRQELALFLILTIVVLYFASVGIYYFENKAQPEVFSSVFDSMWWAVATLTTVGYGDVYPVTVGGKIFTFVILMVGLSIVAVPAGLLSAAFTRYEDEDWKEDEKL